MVTTQPHANTHEVRPIDVRLFILSDVITQFAAGMVISATAWFVFDQTHSNGLVAWVSSANTLGGVAVSVIAGLFIDRFRPKHVALASHAVRVTFMSGPLILFLSFGFQPVFAILLALDNGIGWNLYFPASKTIVQRLAGARGTAGMNSIAEVSMQVGLFSAGAVAGVIYRAVGFYPILFASAAIMLLGLLVLSRVRVPDPPDDHDGDHTSVHAGIAYFRTNPRALMLSLVLCAPFIAATICSTALPGYAKTVLGTTSVGYGLIGTAWGAGACVAGIAMARSGNTRAKTGVVVAGLLTLATYALVMTVNSHTAIAIVATVFAGAAAAGTRIALYTEIMSTVASRFLGRILTLGNLASLLLQTVPAQSTGLVMDTAGAQYGYLLVVPVSLAFTAVYLASPRTPDGRSPEKSPAPDRPIETTTSPQTRE